MRDVTKAQQSFRHYLEVADRAAAFASNEADARAAMANSLSDSRHGLEVGVAIEAALTSNLPHLFRIYTEEVERLFAPRAQLQEALRGTIRSYFDLAGRFAPGSHGAFGGTAEQVYFEHLSEARGRAGEAAEEHFRRPGARPWWQRHALIFGALTFALGLVAERGSEILAPKIAALFGQ